MNLYRRDILGALTSTPALVASPASAQASETTILRLFHEWEASRQRELDFWQHSEDTPENDAISDLLVEETENIKDAILALPCQDARDFIAKIVASSCFGVWALPSESSDPAFWGEARALIA